MKLKKLTYYLMFIICTQVLTVSQVKAQKFSDNEIKTAFIFNFIKFTKWQQAPNPIKVGIVGSGDLAQTILAKLNGQAIGNVPVDVLVITDSSQITQYDVIIFLNRANNISQQIISSLTFGKPILTIGTTEEFVKQGGIISIVQNQNGKKKFVVNISNLKKSKINLSSKLLALAKIIY